VDQPAVCQHKGEKKVRGGTFSLYEKKEENLQTRGEALKKKRKNKPDPSDKKFRGGQGEGITNEKRENTIVQRKKRSFSAIEPLHRPRENGKDPGCNSRPKQKHPVEKRKVRRKSLIKRTKKKKIQRTGE